jgi:hypothetical protein
MALPATEAFTGGTVQQGLSSFNASWTHICGGAQAWIVNDSGHSGEGRPFNASDYCIATWNADAFANNQYSEFTVTAIGSGHLGAFVRGASGADGYACRADGYITRYDDAGSLSGETILASGLTTATTGDVVRGEAEGTTLRTLIDGVSAGSITDATYASGSAGLWGYNGGDNYIDNWEGGNLAAAGNPWYAYAQQ